VTVSVRKRSRWRLNSGELHIWSASLDEQEPYLDRFTALLSEDELERADRFRFTRDRARYIVGRGLLRTLLGGYAAQDPGALLFAYNEYGKPELPEWPDLRFNLAHSESRALFALARSTDVGVDLERRRPEFAQENVAEHFFSPYEVEVLRGLADHEQADAFLACWTRKEAFLKARGDGLSLPLHDFDVTLAPGKPAALLRTAWSRTEPQEWRLYDLSGFYPGYAAALSVRWNDGRIVIRHGQDSLLPAVNRTN